MSDQLLNQIIENQNKILDKISRIEENIAEIQDGQRVIYVSQRDLEMKVRETQNALTFMKFTLNDDVVKKLNVLIDDSCKFTKQTKEETGNPIYKEFAALRKKLSGEDIDSFEHAKIEAKQE